MRILVSGSIAYDKIMDFPDTFDKHILPEKIKNLNVSFTVNEFRETFGGTAGNICYNLALLKQKSFLYGAVGKDFGRYESRFKKYNVDTAGVKKYNKTYTASAYIITDKNDNQITGFFPGALIFRGKKPVVNKDDIAIIAPGNALEMLDLSEYYKKRGIFFIFDPGQQIISFTKNQLRKAILEASAYIVNDYEMSLTEKITGWSQEIILQKAGILITTLGKDGSTIDLNIKNKLERVKIKAIKPQAVKDPTGSGDAYRAGLLKGLSFNKKYLKADLFKIPWLEVGQLATTAATYAVENYGTQTYSYTPASFLARYKKNYNQIIKL